MSAPLRLGLAGTGGMAATMAGLARRMEGITPAAVLSHDAGRAAGLATRFGAGWSGTDRAAFLDPGRIDAVYVAGRNRDHADLTLAAIAAGLPVLVEKPLGCSATETAAVFSAAQERGVVVMENLWTLALPAWGALRAACAAGDLGRARLLRFDFSQPVTPAALPGLFDPVDGGVLRDRAVYGLAAAVDLFGPVADVQASLERDAQGVDTAAVVMLRHAGGGQALISVALDGAGANDLVVQCDRGILALGRMSLGAEWLGRRPMAPLAQRGDALAGPGRLGQIKAALRRSAWLRRRRGPGPGLDWQFHPHGESPYRPALAAFGAAVRGGVLPVPAALSQEVARLVDLIREHAS